MFYSWKRIMITATLSCFYLASCGRPATEVTDTEVQNTEVQNTEIPEESTEAGSEVEEPVSFTEEELKQMLLATVGNENVLCVIPMDYNRDGYLEAFAATGEDDGEYMITNAKIYFVSHTGEVSCIDQISEVVGYGGYYNTEYFKAEYQLVDTGKDVFFLFNNLTEGTRIYGLKDGVVYQPEASGKHAAFYKADEQYYNGDPHDGGSRSVYTYEPETQEFILVDTIGYDEMM